MTEAKERIFWSVVAQTEHISKAPLETIIIRESQVLNDDPQLEGEDALYYDFQRSKQRESGQYFQVSVIDGQPCLVPLDREELFKACDGKYLSSTFSFSIDQENGFCQVIDGFEIIDRPVIPGSII